jgi:hypothetical protein
MSPTEQAELQRSGKIARLARDALRFIQLEEASGSPPTHKAFTNFAYFGEALDPDVEAAWTQFLQAIGNARQKPLDVPTHFRPPSYHPRAEIEAAYHVRDADLTIFPIAPTSAASLPSPPSEPTIQDETQDAPTRHEGRPTAPQAADTLAVSPLDQALDDKPQAVPARQEEAPPAPQWKVLLKRMFGWRS